MQIIVNGDSKEVPEGLTVVGLLDHLHLRPDRVVIELNAEILPKNRWADTHLRSDDRFEIVHLVGGG